MKFFHYDKFHCIFYKASLVMQNIVINGRKERWFQRTKWVLMGRLVENEEWIVSGNNQNCYFFKKTNFYFQHMKCCKNCLSIQDSIHKELEGAFGGSTPVFFCTEVIKIVNYQMSWTGKWRKIKRNHVINFGWKF